MAAELHSIAPSETPQEGFDIALDPGESYDLLVLSGHINLDAATKLHEVALQAAAGARPLQVDWSRAEHVGASAVQVLLALSTALHSRGHTLEIRNDSPRVRGFLDLAGLSAGFPLAVGTEAIR